MRKFLFLILLLIPVLCFAGSIQKYHMMIIGQEQAAAAATYVHNLTFEDDAASTVVTNAGTGNDWTAFQNTSLFNATTTDCAGANDPFYCCTGSGTGTCSQEGSDSFEHDATNEGSVSPANWTDEQFEFSAWFMFDAAEPTGHHYLLFAISDGDGSTEANEFGLWIWDTTDELMMRASGTGVESNSSTNFNMTADAWVCLAFDVDVNASPFTVTAKFHTDAGRACEYTDTGASWTNVTWAGWTDGNPTAISTINSPVWIGTGATLSFLGSVDGFRMRAK